MGLFSFIVGATKAAITIAKGPDPADATPNSVSLVAALGRITRWGNNEAVAVSLAGGGAWGLGGIGLIRRCKEQGLPIDFVAGVSSGSLLAAMFAWRSSAAKDGLDVLEDREDETYPLLWACMLSMKPMLHWIEAVTGKTKVHETEARLMAFHTVVMDGAYHEATSGTVGEAAVAASVFAPIFAPYDYENEAVLDGAFAYNLPPRTALWSSGGSFFVTGNPIPEKAQPHPPLKGAIRHWLVTYCGPARRARDFTYGVMHLFHRVTEDCAKDSDLHCDMNLVCWGPSDFDQMKEISKRALDQARRELSHQHDPWWAYHNWMYLNGTVTGLGLGPAGSPPALGPAPPATCP